MGQIPLLLGFIVLAKALPSLLPFHVQTVPNEPQFGVGVCYFPF